MPRSDGEDLTFFQSRVPFKTKGTGSMDTQGKADSMFHSSIITDEEHEAAGVEVEDGLNKARGNIFMYPSVACAGCKSLAGLLQMANSISSRGLSNTNAPAMTGRCCPGSIWNWKDVFDCFSCFGTLQRMASMLI